MKATRSLPALFVVLVALAGTAYLLLPERETVQSWEQRKARLLQATTRADPLILAIMAYTTATGHPPRGLNELVPEYLEDLPATGLRECGGFDYRPLTHKQGSIVWYDLGSRQGQPYTGQSRYSDGEPGHAILVFSLDAKEQITSALLDRMPKDREPQDFDPARWAAGENRIEMALALADTFRLFGMPREVFERLLGKPDGGRPVHGPLWELRMNCPTGLLSHDAFLYWPTESYPQHLYGGKTEAIGRWVYVHS